MLTQWSSRYYRTRAGAEVDLILSGPFGVIPIEIKYGVKVNRRQLKSLESFVKDNSLDLGLLINQASEAHWLSRYVFQLPENYL